MRTIHPFQCFRNRSKRQILSLKSKYRGYIVWEIKKGFSKILFIIKEFVTETVLGFFKSEMCPFVNVAQGVNFHSLCQNTVSLLFKVQQVNDLKAFEENLKLNII